MTALIEPVKRKGGRPRAAEPRASVCTWIPAQHHDHLIRIAQMRGVSVSSVVRSLVVIGLTKAPRA